MQVMGWLGTSEASPQWRPGADAVAVLWLLGVTGVARLVGFWMFAAPSMPPEASVLRELRALTVLAVRAAQMRRVLAAASMPPGTQSLSHLRVPVRGSPRSSALNALTNVAQRP